MPNKINLKVYNTHTAIEGKLDSSIFSRLRKETGYYMEDAKYVIANSGREGWDGIIPTICYKKCRCAIQKEGSHFPTGLIGKVREILSSEKISVCIEDCRDTVNKSLNLEINYNKAEERDYQLPVINNSVKQERAIIKMATGGGKSFVGCGIYAKLAVSPFIFYVPSLFLLEQMHREISKFVLKDGKPIDVGKIGGNSYEIRDVNVMTIQTAVRSLGQKYKKIDDEESNEKDSKIVIDHYKDIKNLIMTSKGMIADEIQHWAAESCQVISDHSVSSKYRFGLSATPFRDLGDDILIDACFGKTVADISASHLIEKGFLVQPTIYFIPISNMRGIKGFTYQELYKSAIVENTERNKIISDLANKMYLEGRNILILVKQVNHGNLLKELINSSVFLHGSCSKKEREDHLELVREGKKRLTIATSIADEGVDCKPWDTLILAGSGKSKTRALQRVGRILRPFKGKKEATVIDFMDNCKWMLGHSRKRKSIYQTEPKFKIEELTIK